MLSINQLLTSLFPVISFTLLLFPRFSSPLIIYKRTYYDKALNYTDQFNTNLDEQLLLLFFFCSLINDNSFPSLFSSFFFVDLGFFLTCLPLSCDEYLKMSFYFFFYSSLLQGSYNIVKNRIIAKFRKLEMYNRSSVQCTNFKVHKKKWNVYI